MRTSLFDASDPMPEMPAWRPDLTSLHLFAVVCDEGSIARAAQREGIAPSAVSRRVAELETACGTSLLVRGGRGVRPTPAGRSVLHHARQMLRSADQLRVDIGDYVQGAIGHVRLCANTSSIAEFLPADLSAFLRLHKNVKVDLSERFSTAVVEAVRRQDADVGVCLDTVDLVGLHVEHYAVDNLVVLTPPGHRLALRREVSLADTLAYEFVGLAPESRMSSFLSSMAARVGRPMSYRMHVASFELMGRIVAEGLAIAIAPEDAVRELQARLGLALVRLAEPWAVRRIVLCVLDATALAPAARQLVEHLRARGQARPGALAGMPGLRS